MSSAEKRVSVEEMADLLHELRLDPVRYVYWAWDWQGDPELQVVDYDDPEGPSYEGLRPYRERFGTRYGPDLWFLRFLEEVGEEVRRNDFDGRSAVPPIRRLVASGHGIGKSAGVGMLASWIRDTRPMSRGTVTANTFPQLEGKTWREITRWGKRAATSAMWEFRGDKILHRVHGKDWAVYAQTCSPENADAFQGQHSVGSTSYYLVDECSGIDPRIWTAMEGGLSDGEPMIYAFGNPTRNDSRMAQIMTRERHRWHVVQVDSRRAYITAKVQLQTWIDDHGEDSDFVRVRVRGELPRSSSFQLIPSDSIHAAREREAAPTMRDPVIVGVDVARHGPCETVIACRRGFDARAIPWRFSRYTANLVTVADEVARYVDDMERLGEDWRVDAVLVDATGMGWGVVDELRRRGYPVHAVETGRKADKSHAETEVANLGTACWVLMRDWLQRGGIPDDPVLARQLETRSYGFTDTGALKLEPKEKIIREVESGATMSDDASPSPDRADALAVTFGVRIAPRRVVHQLTEIERMQAKRERMHRPVTGVDNPLRRYM